MTSFSELGLNPHICLRLHELGITEPTPIQEQGIPPILQGRDVVGQAKTGTGKTFAFGLPLLQKVTQDPHYQALIMTPTRELAAQVARELEKVSPPEANCSITLVTGGKNYREQGAALKRHPNIIVATPGRFIDLMDRGWLYQFTPKTVVLDEADEMLDMGFEEDIRSILSSIGQKSQKCLFSATMPKGIKNLIHHLLVNPEWVQLSNNNDQKKSIVNSDITQSFSIVSEKERSFGLLRLLDNDLGPANKALIFCRTRAEVDRIALFLSEHGYQTRSLHGDLDQNLREKVMHGFRTGQFQVLVATDIAARGLDVSDVTHVYNYQLPVDPESYVHRIGRTGRAQQKGFALSLVSPRQVEKIHQFMRHLKTEISYRSIPTRNQLNRSRMNQLRQDLSSMEDSEDYTKLANKMLNETENPVQLMANLIQWTMNKLPIAGPEQIGVGLHELDQVLEKRSNSNRKRNARRDRSSSGSNFHKKGRGNKKRRGFGGRNQESSSSYGRKKGGDSRKKPTGRR